MNFLFLLPLILATLSSAARNPAQLKNPVVVAPQNGTYNAGDIVEIKWKDATTGFVNIQLVNDFTEVLNNPLTIALGVPAGEGKYSWKVPASLRTATGYHVIVWGVKPSAGQEKSGQTSTFTIVNNIPQAVNTFKVLSPNADKRCAVNAPCVITWDFPEHMDQRPAYVHVRMFKGDSQTPALYIAQVPADQKTYTWNVPNEKGLLAEDMYISVSSESSPPAGPGLGDNNGGNGQIFKMEATLTQPAIEPTSVEAEPETETVHATSTVKKTTTAKISKQDSGAGALSFSPAVLVLAIIPLAFMF